MKTKVCSKCSLEIITDSYVEVLDAQTMKKKVLCIQCWKKDLDSDSGTYFDNFVSK